MLRFAMAWFAAGRRPGPASGGLDGARRLRQAMVWFAREAGFGRATRACAGHGRLRDTIVWFACLRQKTVI